MTADQWWIMGALCAVMAIIWLGDLFFSAPEEDFDTDMSQKEQEAQAQGEQQIALREAHCNTASDEYFGARPQVDDATKRRIYEAGFKEGWESGIGNFGAPPQPHLKGGGNDERP